ncbi:hypothetical protein NE237_004426 [Protea cynaroides]|uniref:Uncharacterized protein n=1 Tax=Protea cynaroides TaxID=273540 RepID=A0A9Q0KIV3_9MAGN|nr:hypothetical protein NE237_004426 [Protea cynaroides]
MARANSIHIWKICSVNCKNYALSSFHGLLLTFPSIRGKICSVKYKLRRSSFQWGRDDGNFLPYQRNAVPLRNAAFMCSAGGTTKTIILLWNDFKDSLRRLRIFSV